MLKSSRVEKEFVEFKSVEPAKQWPGGSYSKLHHLFKSDDNFSERGRFCLLVGLHREGSAPANCAEGLFKYPKQKIGISKGSHLENKSVSVWIFFQTALTTPGNFLKTFFFYKLKFLASV